MSKVVERCKAAFPGKIREFYYHGPFIHNHLAQEVNDTFFFLWIKKIGCGPTFYFATNKHCDCFPNPKKLFCIVMKMKSMRSTTLFLLAIEKTRHPHISLFFEFFSHKGLLIPRALWQQAGGLKREGAEYEDLLLRLDTLGPFFQGIPFPQICAGNMQRNFAISKR